MKSSEKPKKSQVQQILNAMLAGQIITELTALKRFGCLRLSGRILEIKSTGKYRIKTEMVKLKNRKRVAQYSIPL